MKKILFLIVLILIFFVSCASVGPVYSNKTIELKASLEEFIKNGFGFEYKENELRSMKAFIQKHGDPLEIYRSDKINNHDGITDEKCILQYKDYEVCFLNFTKRELWNAPESLLMYISSTKNGKYKYGIEVGDKREIIEKKLNIELSNESQEFRNKEGNIITILVKDGLVDRIIWEYGRE